MPRGKKLTDSEMKVISNLKKNNTPIAEIARNVGRSRSVVLHYLKQPDNYRKKHPGGRPKVTTERDRRAILRVASNSCMTARKIATEAGVNTNIRNVQRIIKQAKHLKRCKIQKKPTLKKCHKVTKSKLVG